MPRNITGGLFGACVRGIAFFTPVLLFAVAVNLPALGQVLPNPDSLQQMQQQLGQRQPAVQPDNGGQSTLVLQPEQAQPRRDTPPTRLEQIMSDRARTPLKQFGYDQLGTGRAVTVPQTGAVQDDYVLGPGDEIVLSLRGTELVPGETRALVDRNGQVLLPRLSPVPATGRTFGSFRRDVEAAVRTAYVATTAFVSIGRVRQISVLVSGEVNNPGQRLVTGLSSVVDALLLSGGVRKTGSLRNVRIQRSGREISVDLYSVLTSGGGRAPMRLADGDRILVPPLGPTVAISGLVRQPGIFELPARQSSISVNDLLQAAGGTEVRGLYRYSLLRIDADGRTNFVSVSQQGGIVLDSEILFVQMGADQVVNRATLSGGGGLAGTYAITAGTRLSELLKAPGALGLTPYTLLGLVVRRDKQSLTRVLIPFTPISVVQGRGEDIALESEDTFKILSVAEIRLLDFVIQSYMQRLADQNTAMRDTLGGVSTGQLLPSQQQESSRQLALSYISNVPAETQRRMINVLLDEAAPGTPEGMRRLELDRMARETAIAAENQAARQAAVPQGAPGQLQQPPPQQQGAVFQPPRARTTNNQVDRRDDGADRDVNGQRKLDEYPGSSFNRDAETFGELVRQLNVDPLVLINFLVENRVRVEGAVRGPGDYLVGPSVSLNDLVQAAGGTVNWADESGVELVTTAIDQAGGRASTQRRTLPLRSTTLASYIVRPRDQIRFAQVFSSTGVGAVTVQGEIRSPGTFSILRGDRLSDVLARAGGLTSTAYAAGTVFLRQSSARLERESYARAARDVEEQLVVAMTRAGSTRMDPSVFTSLQSFVQELRNQRAVGRISVVADPSILASRPELDPLLEADDVIYIPQRPSTISVLGQVMQAGSFPYVGGESVAEYIQKAGGYSRTADSSETFVILPDGSARKLEQSWFRFSSTGALPPGSTIVVPRDLAPLDLRQTVLDLAQILSQLAVSVASVAVISK